jgi:5-methylthioadenosine/S-adenosylhomocysteine deaminase
LFQNEDRALEQDLLVRGGNVLTMDPAIGDLPCGDVHIRGDRIVAVGPSLDVPGAQVIDARGKIVLPGLVDGHRHVWQSIMRGVAADWTLPQYMVEARAMYCGCFDSEDAYLANYLGGLESLAAGITTVVDHCHLQSSPEVSDALARGLKDSGVGGVFCYALQNVPNYVQGGPIDGDAAKDLLTRLPDDWHDANAARLRDTYFGSGPLLFGVAMPEATPYMPAEYSAGLFARAQALNPKLITGHWNAISKPGFYQSSLSELITAGAFKTSTLLSHNNSLNDDDLKLMVSSSVGLCTCPDIECGMGLGALMARRFVEMGGAASLGVDITSFVQADLFKQARLMLQAERKRMADEAGHMPMEVDYTTRAVLELLTLTGARSLGMEDEIGSLTPGKRADLIIVASNPLLAAPMAEPEATLIFFTDASDIDTVLVAGTIRKRDAALVGIDWDDLREKTRRSAAAISERYKSLPREKLENVWAGMF